MNEKNCELSDETITLLPVRNIVHQQYIQPPQPSLCKKLLLNLLLIPIFTIIITIPICHKLNSAQILDKKSSEESVIMSVLIVLLIDGITIIRHINR